MDAAEVIGYLAKSTGVNEESVRKVLEELGLSKAINVLSEVAGSDAGRHIHPDNLKIAIRVGKSAVAV